MDMKVWMPAAVMILAVAATPAPDATNLVAAALQTLATEQRGVVGFRQTYHYEERGPAHDVSREVDEWRVTRDGRLVSVRIEREITNGQAVSNEQLARDQAAADKQLPAEDYRLPLTPEAVTEYRLEPASCTACAPGSQAVAFTSLRRDGDHADGVMIVDATRHIVELRGSPSVLPAHVDNATIVMHFGPVLADLWNVVDDTQHYDGHMLFIHGYAVVRRTYSEYRRFASVEAAQAADTQLRLR
jgi:hypothetical protein